jgi:hypothetical protein
VLANGFSSSSSTTSSARVSAGAHADVLLLQLQHPQRFPIDYPRSEPTTI